MSSHREAPGISKDPVADSTDVYAFVSPDKPDTVTLIANYIPFEDPAGGPNFFEFGDDVIYTINVDNTGDGKPDVTYEFKFTTVVANGQSFLYNTGPITDIADPAFNRRQYYTLTKITRGKRTILGADLMSPPCNVGPRSTPNYPALAQQAVHTLKDGTVVFAGQRLDPFYVDLGSIFDLGDLRPFQNLHLIPTAAGDGVDALRNFNVHSIAVQVPITDLTRDGSKPTVVAAANSTIGVWTAAMRRKGTVRASDGSIRQSGPYVQVSRLGNPLFNEVIVPMEHKDVWNTLTPAADGYFAKYVTAPELAKLIPVLYPGGFPNLAGLTKPRADLQAILLTGIPADIIPGFQNNTGTTLADMLRLNVAIPPASAPNAMGILGGDLAGFPNGRRPMDDVVAIELQAIAGATYPLVDKTFTPDAAASKVTDGVSAEKNVTFLAAFPYCDHPKNGFDVVPLG